MSVGSGFFVEIQTGAGEKRRTLLKGVVVIGRSAAADVVVDHPSVSRKHAELTKDERGHWFVKDLDSRNGASIKQQALQNGDEIKIGEVVGRFIAESAPSAPSPDADDAPGISITTLHEIPRPGIAADNVAAILSFGRALAETPAASERLRRLLDLAVKQEVGGWWSYALRVSEVDGQIQMRTLAEPAASPYGASREAHLSKSVLRAVLQGGEPVVANQLAKAQRFEAAMSIAPEAATFSAVACPLGPAGEFVDVLYVVLPPDLGSVQWMMLINFAVWQYRHADAAWEARNAAELQAGHEREMALARGVQARTLPRQGPGNALEWAVRFEPCYAVAGDYVDVVERDDGSLLLLIADAAGKGMQAALITAGLHAIFHTQGRTDSSLPQVVGAADRYLKTFLPDNSFVTFAAVLLDLRTGQGASVNCGHPPMLAIDKAGQLRPLDGGDNLPLGLCLGDVVSSPVRLDPDEWLIGHTDGLNEMRNAAGDMLGLDALQTYFKTLRGSAAACTADDLAARITAWLDDFRGPIAANDDRTLLIVRRR